MQNLERFINAQNAAHAIRYLLNCDMNALNEKTIKFGITNILDIEQTKKLYCSVFFTQNIPSVKTEHFVQQAMDLTRALNEEAKQNLIEYLVTQQA